MDLAAPFPYFGGKRRAAPIIWQLLGDPSGYVEPFAGSAAVLLARPTFKGRRVETLNDADGWLVNTWRSIQLAPDQVAAHAAGPVTEIDYHARLAWLQERRTPDLVAWLEGHPEHHDPKAAGWWLYVTAAGIGDPFGRGPWRVVDGHLRKLPHLGDAGQGVKRELPHLGDAGQGTCTPYRRGSNGCASHAATGGASPPHPHQCQQGTPTPRGRRTRHLRAGAGGDGSRAVLLDPPYATSGDLYAETTLDVAIHAREWATSRNAAGMRIIICGYDNEHDTLLGHGWQVTEGRAGGGGGYSTNGRNGRRERLWYNPNCLPLGQGSLFDTVGAS